MPAFLHLVFLFSISCALVIPDPPGQPSLPTQAVQVESSSYIIPSNAIRAFLAGLLVPVLFRFIIDSLDSLSGARPENVSLPMAKIATLIAYFYMSLVIGLGLVVYAICRSNLELGGAGIGVLVALYSSNHSRSSSSRLYTLWRRFPHSSKSSSAAPSLLCYTLKELTRLAINSHLWATIPFNQFVDLVKFCLQLNDADLLERLFGMPSSYSITLNLCEIQQRIPEFQSLHEQGNESVSQAFRALMCQAMRPEDSNSLGFPSRVGFVTYCMKLEDAQLVNDFLDPNTGSSRPCATKLQEMYNQLPDPNCLPPAGRRHLPSALKDLLQMAKEENSSAFLPFYIKVKLVMLCLKTIGLNSVNDHPPWTVIGDTHGNRAMVVYGGVEGRWLRAWLHQFHGSTFEQDENQIIWHVAVHYSRT